MTIHRFALALACAATLFAGAAGCVDQAVAPPPATMRFEFHSAFLMNLHHFLVDAARHPGRIDAVRWDVPPTAGELAALHDAVAFYASTIGKRDLLFDDELRDVKHALARDGAPGYVRYAEKNGVFQRAWPQYVPLLHDDWRAWIAGRGSLKAAVDAMLAGQSPA